MNVAMKQPDFEAVGEAFDADKMFEQRDRTREVIGAIAAAVRPGMVEEDAVAMAKAMLAKRKMLRGWHDVYVRFGTNTTKTFGAASDPGIVLGDDDIFLIDVGPVFEKWEGDGGDTFVTGDDPDMARCAVDARALAHRGTERPGPLCFRRRGSRETGLGAEYGPVGAPDFRLPARGDL